MNAPNGASRKKSYIAAALALVAGMVIAYHFYAASVAEKQIHRAIQEQTKNRPVSAQYSAIAVGPFTGTVTFSDLTFIWDTNIHRAGSLEFNIGYLDFLNIYAGGIEYGLNKLERVDMHLIDPAFIGRSGHEEVKADSLQITFRGNLLDALQSLVGEVPLPMQQTVEARGSNATLSLPATPFSRINATRLHYRGTFSPGQPVHLSTADHTLRLDSLTWTPSQKIQETYSFFIKGFGYPTDRIPVKYASFHTEPAGRAGSLSFETQIKSELLLFKSSGRVDLQTPLAESQFREARLTLSEFSKSFSGVLANMENLFAIRLPRNDNQIELRLGGSLSNPRIVQ